MNPLNDGLAAAATRRSVSRKRLSFMARFGASGAMLLLHSEAALASPYADLVWDYSQGTATTSNGSTFSDPAKALGAPDTNASLTAPSTEVYQLGQRGFITLGFSQPIANKAAGQIVGNPAGVDFVVFGNAFEQVFVGSGSYFREPGFVEVAQKNPDGSPGTFYFLVPDILPSALVGGTTANQNGDTGPGATLPAGYADVHPVDGAGNHLIAPDQAGSAGGDGFFLEKAILQSAPGVPLLDGLGQYQYVTLDHVDFVRITDALPSDGSTALGGYTTDVDAVVALPVPEPALAGWLAAAMLLLRGRKGRCPC